MAFIDVKGRSVHYEIHGEGPRTIVWTHGIGSSLETWKQHLPEFPGFRHVIYSVRGMGESQGIDGPVRLEDWASDLDGLMEALDIPSAIIAGHSMGGAISQRFVIDYPQRVEALLLLSTSSRVGAALEAAWLRQAEEIEATNPHLAAARRAVSKYNMDEGLKAVDVPTLILVGGKDPQTPPGGSVIMSRLIPGSQMQIFPGIGHSIFPECPDAKVRAREWLATLN
ncbi:MAG: alpha/beta fold hydrolase [Dehalococcoidia bacterium]|nr:alpha/beta fold hydrolase [Dehalococcoidia bacterium]MCB9483248.1 alpha/beta fold hydrolase [Dehalococcoidia bacterium]MCB9492293.1 alpha/beta fold hydrolase [Dehalococcoidia bacterium]